MRAIGEAARAWARVGLGWRYHEEAEGEEGAVEGVVEGVVENIEAVERGDDEEGGMERMRRPWSGEG